MGVIAGILLIIFGTLYFKKPIVKSNETIEIKAPSAKAMLIKGFLLNILNPAVWILWLGNVTAVGSKLNYSVIKMIIYFSITLGLVLLVELGKIVASAKLKQFLTDKIMLTINRITGALLIAFGSVLIYNNFFGKL
jgi:threonine/homoserine/homoserine lactone efflux protein